MVHTRADKGLSVSRERHGLAIIGGKNVVSSDHCMKAMGGDAGCPSDLLITESADVSRLSLDVTNLVYQMEHLDLLGRI